MLFLIDLSSNVSYKFLIYFHNEIGYMAYLYFISSRIRPITLRNGKCKAIFSQYDNCLEKILPQKSHSHIPSTKIHLNNIIICF